MATPGTHRRRSARTLGIALLILGLARVPLPRADYHNVRHHDGPGQSCPLHDHLLHWHPGASRSADIAILHWHWVPPLDDPESDPSNAPGAPPILKPLSCDGLAADCEDAPRLLADDSSRPAILVVAPLAFLIDSMDLFNDPPPRPAKPPARLCSLARSFSATFTPDIPLRALFGRWTC